jgi:hypothetical protein
MTELIIKENYINLTRSFKETKQHKTRIIISIATSSDHISGIKKTVKQNAIVLRLVLSLDLH